MRIALLLNARYPTQKAYGIQINAMARGFLQAGAEVAVVFPRRTSEVPGAIEYAGKQVEFLPYGPKLTLYAPWMFHGFRLLGAVQAVQPLRAWKPDIVLANDPVQAAYLAPHFPVVWDLHDLPNPGSITHRQLMRRIWHKARGLVSTNQLKLDALAKAIGMSKAGPGPKFLVSPNPVSLDPAVYSAIGREEARAKLGLPGHQKVMVYAGQLFDWKGVDTVVRAMPRLPRDIVFHIVGGSGADLERVSALAARSGDGRIVLHGQRPPEDVPYWLRAADVVVVPNSGKFAVSARDTNPMKVYEALAAGAAVVASDLPSMREAVPQAGVIELVAADDEIAWADAIGRLMADPSRLEALRGMTQRTGLFQSPVERARQLLAFFQTLVR